MIDLIFWAVLGLLALLALLLVGSLAVGIIAMPFYLVVGVWDALRSPSAEQVAENERVLSDA